jgi:hypothetical protein
MTVYKVIRIFKIIIIITIISTITIIIAIKIIIQAVVTKIIRVISFMVIAPVQQLDLADCGGG